jgi:hypothetical protein
LKLFVNKQDSLKKIAKQMEIAKAQMPADVREAHRHCSVHRSEIMASEMCGCFYCLQIFRPNEITDWIDDGQTAECAKCGIDSVIGSGSGFPITKKFLEKMNDYWFGESPSR